MNATTEAREVEFAYKIRRALTESSEALPQATLDQLARARAHALARKKADAPALVPAWQPAWAGPARTRLSSGLPGWMGKAGMALPLLFLLLGMFAIYEYEQQQHINELADIDAAMLVDELPPSAYTDTGFATYVDTQAKE